MAFTERYVTVAGAGAHDGTSEANAWTFAEMITAAPSGGTRVNVKAGSYSVGAYTLGAGTAAAPFVIRGYNSTPGDLDNLGRDATGALVTTNMPDITLSAAWVPTAQVLLQNLDITGALSSALLNSAGADFFNLLSCRVVNTQNNAAAACLRADNDCQVINCDFECTGAAHGFPVYLSGPGCLHNCRFKGVDADALLQVDAGRVEGCVFIGNGSNKGLVFIAGSSEHRVIGCTFYNLTTAIEFPNLVNTEIGVVINNHVTDCSKFIDSLYSGTALIPLIIYNNRTRDVTTLLTGIESIEAGAVTTDTGGASTDYTNAGADDLTLISGAPGLLTGMGLNTDIGALQRLVTPGGGGGQTSHCFIG
jgi:hypothetical protein